MAEEERPVGFRSLSERPDEEEYFYRQDLDLVRRLREVRNKEREVQRLKAEQEAHWMRCPKCGGTMEEAEQGAVKIDICTRCGGSFFDKGELDLVLKMNEKASFLDRLSQKVDAFFTQGFNIKRAERPD
ncbi:MAG: zf-TFIIB domain-containing protein [Acidobacteriota bacterium]